MEAALAEPKYFPLEKKNRLTPLKVSARVPAPVCEDMEGSSRLYRPGILSMRGPFELEKVRGLRRRDGRGGVGWALTPAGSGIT